MILDKSLDACMRSKKKTVGVEQRKKYVKQAIAKNLKSSTFSEDLFDIINSKLNSPNDGKWVSELDKTFALQVSDICFE